MDAIEHELVEFAGRLADAGGEVHRRYYEAALEPEAKPDGSPVTVADRETERTLRGLIETRYPEHGIRGEEMGTVRGDAGHLWIIDPIDGTKSFLAHIPTCGLLIGLAVDGELALGIIDHPILGERWVGARGHPTTRNGEAVRTRACASLEDAILTTPGPKDDAGAEDEAAARLRRACRWPRYGVDCYAFGLVASGRIDVAVDYGLHLFDYSPLPAVVAGAGGVACDWEGRPLGPDSGSRVVAVGDRRLLDPVLELLNRR